MAEARTKGGNHIARPMQPTINVLQSAVISLSSSRRPAGVSLSDLNVAASCFSRSKKLMACSPIEMTIEHTNAP
jgi:hypothetical protein